MIMKKFLFPLIFLLSCYGCAFQVPLSDNFSSSPLAHRGKKTPLKVGLYIDKGTKNLEDRVRPSGIGASAHKFVFPVGDKFSKLTLRASEASFEKVEEVDDLPQIPSQKVDAYLIVENLKSNIQVRYTNMTTAIVFGLVGQLLNPIQSRAEATFSVSIRCVDSNLKDLFLSTAHGQGYSEVQSSRTSFKPRPEEFSEGINSAVQDLVTSMMTEILDSKSIKDYAAKVANINRTATPVVKL
jgi:hypothetical protein